MSRSDTLRAAESPRALFALPLIRPGVSDKPVQVGRADLANLCERIIGRTQDTSGAAALQKAARVIRGWLSRRPELNGSDWGKYLRKLARGLSDLARGATTKTPFRLFGEGNGKLPFVTFSTLPVFTCPGAGECARWCYSFRAWRYPAAFARQLQNTLLLWFMPAVIRAAFLALPGGITFRLYVDGDFSSLADVDFWMSALRARPDVKAYGYSKSWDLLHLWGADNGQRWPENYALNLSSGGRALATEGQMKRLPVTRGVFACVNVRGIYRPQKKGNVGFARYDDPDYYRAVRQAAEQAGYGKKVFLCPGLCGDCTPKGHACGMAQLRGVVIVNGEH